MILHIEQGCFSYHKNESHDLLHNIEFKANSGELIAILGPNGVGKTTLLKCLIGLLSWTKGKSTLDGKDIKKISPSHLWQNIGYVPQAKNTIVAYPVEEMILLGRSSHLSFFQKPRPKDLFMVNNVMKQLHIESLSGKKCNEISGGELQMVLIAKALLSEPQILILDEPESNLDYKNQIIILDTMSRLSANGMTCIFNTHYPAHALQRANKALLLNKDGTYLFGNVNDVITEQNLAASFGVHTIIGEIETPSRIVKDVVPLSVQVQLEQASLDNINLFQHSQSPSSNNTETAPTTQDIHQSYLAVISIIMNTDQHAKQINHILHDYQTYLVGRMGMPYRNHHLYIINLTVDAPKQVTDTLTQQLMMLPDLSVKTTFEQ